MQARFIGEAQNGVCHVFDEVFEAGRWTKVDHLADAHRAALIGNPTFETKAHDADAAAIAGEAAAATATPALELARV
jgi:hypothetical protein